MAADHTRYLELLPWYASGTLAEHERAEVQEHLKQCLVCNAALRDERRLGELMQDQGGVPLGPDRGITELMRRIDRSERRHGFRVRLSAPVLGYGLAAALGGAIVWMLMITSGPPVPEGRYSTLTSDAGAAPNRIDVVFAREPTETELDGFLAEIGAELVGGPSGIGRYTLAVESPSEAALAELLDALGNDERVRFAGRAFSGAPAAAEAP